MIIIHETNNIKSDQKIIKQVLDRWSYKPEIKIADKGVLFVFKSDREATNIFKDLKSNRYFKDSWRLELQDNTVFYDEQ